MSPTTRQSSTGPVYRGEPLREAVYARIVGLINSGRFKPGSPLTEASLSRSLGVSRTPVREALLRLFSEGVLVSELAKGFTVRPITASEARDLYPILWTLEALAVRTLRPLTERQLAQLGKLAGSRKKEMTSLKRLEIDNAIHTALVSSNENESLLALIGQFRTNLSRYEIAYALNVESREASDDQHHKIISLVSKARFDDAAQLLSEHWKEGMESVLAWLEEKGDKAS